MDTYKGLFATPLIEWYNQGTHRIVKGHAIYKRLFDIIHSVLGHMKTLFVSVRLEHWKFHSPLQPLTLNVAFDTLHEKVKFNYDTQIRLRIFEKILY